MKGRADEILTRSLELAALRRPKGLGRWMARHYDTLCEGFAAHGPAGPDWEAFVTALAEGGVLAPSGQPYRAETARRTWVRVESKVRRIRQGQPSGPAPKVRPVSRAIPAAAPAADVPLFEEFALAARVKPAKER